MSLDRDGDGFLKDYNTWTPEVMQEMGEADGFAITEEIEGYIMKAREMFSESQSVPSIRAFGKELGMDRKAKALYAVFESGPMKKIAKYGGLPKPTGCV